MGPFRIRNYSIEAAARPAVLLLLALLVSGCAGRVPSMAPEQTATVPVSERAVGTPLVVVLDDPGTRELEVLQVFSARLSRPYEVYNLAHRSTASVTAALAARSPVTVIALGPAAHDLARKVPGLEVFHAGVLVPERTFRGVDALPPFSVQLDYWQQHAPEVSRIGVIGGAGMRDRISELAVAAAARGLTLEQRIVQSDTETVLAFRAMVPRIDGFVFLPDDAVLSPRVIQQMLNHGGRNGVQMLVYSPLMYNMGASLFLQPDPVRVAGALIELVNDPEADPEVTEMRARSRLGS